MKSFISYISVALLLCAPFALAQNYELEQVAVSPFEKSVSRAGKVAFKRVLKLSFKSSGYLAKLTVDEGDYFSANQLLASLAIDELKAEKNSRYAQLLQAKREVNRIKQLIEKNLGSQQELDVAQTNLDTSREIYQISYYNLEKAEIYAPFDGVVLRRYAELAELQSPGKDVLEVAAIENNLVVKVSLTDSEIGFVKVGQKVQVQTNTLGVLEGVISKVPVMSNTDGQLFLVEVLLQGIKAGQGVVAGQIAQVTIPLNNSNFVYRVPVSALIEMDKTGAAILITRMSDGKLVKQAFDVLNIDNQYLYLRAQSQNDVLDIVVNGWQQIEIRE